MPAARSKKTIAADSPPQGVVAELKSVGSLNDPATSRFFSNIMASSGVPVTQTTALTVPAFYCGVRAISEDCAKMGLSVTKPTPNGNGFLPIHHQINDLFDAPNEWMHRYDFVAFAAASYAMRGNAYICVVRENGYTPSQLIPLNPDVCSPQLLPDGRVVFCVSHPLVDKGGAVWVRAEDMLHIRGFSLNGWLGLSPISLMAEAIGVSLVTQQHAAKLFGQGQSISGVIKYPGALSPEAASRLAESWRQSYSGPANSHRPAVLEEGGSFEKVGLTAEESQFLATRAFQLSDIARALRIPQHKLQDLSDAHYNNLEAQELTYVNDTLRPFCDRFESECRTKLLMPAERAAGLRIRFDYDNIVRATTDERYKTYAIGKQNGWLSSNDIRRSEGLSDIEGGDTYRESLATAPAGGDTENDNKVPPTGTPSRNGVDKNADRRH